MTRTSGPVPVDHPALGRLLVARPGGQNLPALRRLCEAELGPDAFAGAFFGLLARRAPPGSTASDAEFRRAAALAPDDLAGLPAEVLDALADAYLRALGGGLRVETDHGVLELIDAPPAEGAEAPRAVVRLQRKIAAEVAKHGETGAVFAREGKRPSQPAAPAEGPAPASPAPGPAPAGTGAETAGPGRERELQALAGRIDALVRLQPVLQGHLAKLTARADDLAGHLAALDQRSARAEAADAQIAGRLDALQASVEALRAALDRPPRDASAGGPEETAAIEREHALAGALEGRLRRLQRRQRWSMLLVAVLAVVAAGAIAAAADPEAADRAVRQARDLIERWRDGPAAPPVGGHSDGAGASSEGAASGAAAR